MVIQSELLSVVAHGGVAGAIVEALVALLLVGVAAAVWLGRGEDEDEPSDRDEPGNMDRDPDESKDEEDAS